jgi:hypothetical protein
VSGRLLLATAALACGLVTPAAVQAQTAPVRVGRSASPIRLDGVPDEAAWDGADSISEFTQREPREGVPATERTVVRLLAGDRGLYVALWAYDSAPGAIRHAHLRRDADFGSDDSFSILLDPLRDHRSGLVFSINPNAALHDAEVISPEDDNEEWDGVWDARARITPLGWTAEILIPWQTLRYRPQDEEWGANFSRYIRHKNEQVLWRAWRRPEGLLFMAAEGTITGLAGLPGRAPVELRPYAASSAVMRELTLRPDGSDSVVALGDQDARVGLDAKVALAGSLTLDATANTDFAQVEVDQQVVNLTRFPLFFPEKRPFFLESGTIFEFGSSGRQLLFYSRRIGLGAGGTPVPLVAGARLTGRVGRDRIGVLAVRTGGSEDAWDLVARVRHDVLQHGSVGAIVSGRTLPGVAGPSTAGGVDFTLPFVIRGQNLVFLGYAAASRDSAGGPTGGTARFGIDYPNDTWDNFIGVNVVGADFHPALGFTPETDVLRHTGHIDYFPRPRWLGLRRLQLQLLSWDVVTRLDGTRSHSSYSITPIGGEFGSGDEFALTLQRFEDVPDEAFDIFPGDTIAPGHYWYNRVEAGFESSSGRPVGYELAASVGDFYTGTATSLEAQLTLRVAPHLIADLQLEQQRVRLASGRFTARSARLRLDVASSARLASTLFVQYDNESERLGLNARFRWIPSPGSDVYVVWNSNWPTGLDGGVPWGRPLRGQLVAKVVYYLRGL